MGCVTAWYGEVVNSSGTSLPCSLDACQGMNRCHERKGVAPETIIHRSEGTGVNFTIGEMAMLP